MDRFGLAFIERLSCFDWLRWVVGVNTKKMVVDEVAGVNAEIMVLSQTSRKQLIDTEVSAYKTCISCSRN